MGNGAKRAVFIDDIMMLAKYFEVTTDYLVGLENEDGTKVH